MEDKIKEALQNIIRYVLPVYTIEGVKYVKLEHAKALKQFAEEAIGKVKK